MADKQAAVVLSYPPRPVQKHTGAVFELLTTMWRQALESYGNYVELSVMADLCADHNLPEDSLLYRWCAKRNKFPFHRINLMCKDGKVRAVPAKYSWQWLREPPDERLFRDDYHTCYLPWELFFALRRRWQGDRFYSNAMNAMAELRSGLVRIERALKT